MLKKLNHLAFIIFSLSPFTYAQSLQFSGINKVSFHQSEFDKSFAGNGFLVKYKGELYAITVKHALLEAKTQEMKTVSIDNHVKEWRIHPNKHPNKYIVLGELLNTSAQEMLDMAVLQKDWLVFRVKENHSNLTPISIRESKLKEGESVTAYGCSYAHSESCEQNAYAGKFIAYEKANIRVSIPSLKPGALRGLSGSPVLDENKQLVGIVSNVFRSLDGNGFDFAPANTNYLKQVLSEL